MIADAGGGLVRMKSPAYPEAVVRPFPGWAGPLSVRETPTQFQIAPGPGGGPLLQQRARFAPGYPELGTSVVGPPTSRSGLTFPPDADETVVLGGGFPLVLTFEKPFPGGWLGDVCWGVYRLLGPCGVQVRTTRPPLKPGDYGQAVVTAGPLWDPAAGLAPAMFPTVRGGYDPEIVYHRGLSDAAPTAAGVVHECCHAWFGPDHPNDPRRPNNVRDQSPGENAILYPDDAAGVLAKVRPWN